MKKILSYLKSEPVMCISIILAVMTSFIVPPDKLYLNYIDFKVIIMLFCLMSVIKGIYNCGFFNMLSQKTLNISQNIKTIAIILINLVFFASMFITNDVSLITFVPFTIAVLGKINPKDLIFVIVMETVAANLGSMLTPFGNPQNLFLFSFGNLNLIEFIKIIAPIAIVSYVLLMAILLFYKFEFFAFEKCANIEFHADKNFYIYSTLFLVSILAVFNAVNYIVAFILVLTIITFLDKSILKQVDYGLLITFAAFFIFVGNMQRIEIVRLFISNLINGNEFLCSVIMSQFISNVPAAIMLSGFTNNVKSLIIGTNIGGLGTLIASLASLISYKQYVAYPNSHKKEYLITFSIINFGLLLCLMFIFKFILN